MTGRLPVLTTSERRAFKKCPAQWWWAYRRGLVPLNGKTGVALWFGIGIHEALAALYQPGRKRDRYFVDVWVQYASLDELVKSTFTNSEGLFREDEWKEYVSLGISMLRGYVNYFDWDKHWDVIAVETPFEFQVPHPSTPQEAVGIFKSTWDGVYRDDLDGKIKLMEHKTAQRIITNHLGMDDQGGSYWATANQVLRERGVLSDLESIDAITYNFLRKKEPDDRPQDESGLRLNKDGTVSKRQPLPLFTREVVYRSPREQQKQIKRLGSELAVMELYRNGTAVPFKNPSNETCPSCVFREMCELEERGKDWQGYRDQNFVVRDPYDRYRKPAL